jgi:SOS-response transcriptional repressor LexA
MPKSEKFKTNPFERAQPVTREFFDIPLLGMVRANSTNSFSGDYNLNELVSNFENTNQDTITLEVLDDAMSHSGIIKGDYITVDLRQHPENGDIVVVKLGERFYIRRLYQENNRIRLETSDAQPTPLVIEVDTPGFHVLGKVLSLSRQF